MPKLSRIITSFLFITVLVLLSIYFIEKIPALDSHENKLRRLEDEMALFTIFRVFDYFFFVFLLVAIISGLLIPCINNCCDDEKKATFNDEKDKLLAEKVHFFLNNVCYIINIGFLITSGVNFICDIEFTYSLTVFVFSAIYLIVRSIFYIVYAAKHRENCFGGICEWGYLGMMYTAGCIFFAPCKEKECKNICDEFKDDKGESCYCCICCCCSLGGICYLLHVFDYYFGLLAYSIFWMIGKFFVFISCCDCWCKEEYDIESFKFNGEGPLNSSEPNDDNDEEDKNDVKEIKDIIKKKIKKIKKKNKKKFAQKLIGEILKEGDD